MILLVTKGVISFGELNSSICWIYNGCDTFKRVWIFLSFNRYWYWIIHSRNYCGSYGGGSVLTGFGNGLVAGAFGAIVISIILLIGGTITAGLAGFTTAAIASVTWIVYIFVTSGFVVGVGGAIGSLISGKN